jgi:flagellar biosynthesis/type III secretory pathway chaperone
MKRECVINKKQSDGRCSDTNVTTLVEKYITQDNLQFLWSEIFQVCRIFKEHNIFNTNIY